MDNVAIIIECEQKREHSKLLSEQLLLPVVDKETKDQYQFLLFYQSNMLKLINHFDPDAGPIWVDFNQGKSAYRLKHQGKGKLPISKACGIKHGKRPAIIDATAGLGQDAFVLAGLGCKMLCIEQQPVLAALLADGLARAGRGDQKIREIAERMTLITGKAEEALASKKTDVVYLDPMYPHQQTNRQAKVNKGMQLFRAFPGTSSNESALIQIALQVATDRVVVKRPAWASPLAMYQPTYQVLSKKHRFDVYKQ